MYEIVEFSAVAVDPRARAAGANLRSASASASPPSIPPGELLFSAFFPGRAEPPDIDRHHADARRVQWVYANYARTRRHGGDVIRYRRNGGLERGEGPGLRKHPRSPAKLVGPY